MKDPKQAIKDLQLKTHTNYTSESFLMQRSDSVSILDYIRRIENLNAAYELLFEKFGLAHNCNDCPMIDGCIYQEGKVEECKVKMLKRAKSLGVLE